MRFEHLSVENQSSILLGEQLLFELLGRILCTNPSRAWLDPLIADDVFESVPFAETQPDTLQGLARLSDWMDAAGKPVSDGALLELKADYAQLFVGNSPMQAPPWESVYFSEERLTFQKETLDVRRWYERMKLQPNTQAHAPEDHIAFELSFIAHCAALARHAQDRQDSTAFADAVLAQQTFLADHLLRWGGKWAELTTTYARTEFYQGLALLVRGGLNEAALIFEAKPPAHISYPGIPTH